MCERLPSIRVALSSLATGFDPAAVTPTEAARVVAEAAAAEASASALKILAAGRAAEGGVFRAAGERSNAEGFATFVGMGTKAACELLRTGRRLREQPRLAAAASSGALSPQKTALLADAIETAPGAEERLLDLASHSTLAELRDACARAKAEVTDLEERRRRIHARRSLRSWSDVDGGWHLSAYGNPEEGAQVMAALAEGTEDAFRAARSEGRREPPEAYAFDALVGLAKQSLGATGEEDAGRSRDDRGSDRVRRASDEAGEGSSASAQGKAGDPPDEATGDSAVGITIEAPAGPSSEAGPGAASPAEESDREHGRRRRRREGARAKILVRIDYDTWLRGVPAKGETCELVGYGPVAVSVVRDLMDRGDAFVTAVMTKGQEVRGVANLGRRPNAAQRSALEWTFPTCAVTGCQVSAGLEADHREDWARTHYTMLDLMDLLCHHHHALKTRENWALVEGAGKRDFVPPGDPRHPRNAAKAPRAPTVDSKGAPRAGPAPAPAAAAPGGVPARDAA